ncbi:MAG: flagellar basal body-associated FliL family protein [Terrimicrobiaceae bacterium]
MAANESDTNPAPGPVQKKSSNPLIPILVVILLVPALCYAVMDFLIIPKLKSASGGGGDHAKAADHGKTKSDSHGGGVKPPGEHTVDFGATVVNLAGSGNSRYLRTNFTIASSDKDIQKIIEENKGSLQDAAISVLSVQSLDALDGANGREVVRKGIISKFNRILGAEVIDQIYFTEFIIQ